MSHSMFDLFKIGVGPSSSHTVGPMVACARFANDAENAGILEQTFALKVDLYGSLALTGHGHATDVACVMGLMGEMPDSIDPDNIETLVNMVKGTTELPFAGQRFIPFIWDKHLSFHMAEVLPEHPNGMSITAFNENGDAIFSKTYFSVGGGFVVERGETEASEEDVSLPYPFDTAEQLLSHCRDNSLSIDELMFENESARLAAGDTPPGQTHQLVCEKIDTIWHVMKACIERGINQEGELPGKLKIRRRAKAMKLRLDAQKENGTPVDSADYVNMFALAVNEENAAGGRVVTAPTNGAAGVIPAIVAYYEAFVSPGNIEGVRKLLATAAAIGSLYKTNASISAAEVGCQGEIGVACSMAAGGLAAAMGGTLEQIENAAEIGMEHNLGLTCDPVDGLVQVPCIERNTMGAIKAINAVRLALAGDGHHSVSLDSVIKTMHQTGLDMQSKYKETSLGGLATNVIPINIVNC
ncbi:L-serine ammonia-lyase [Parasalinivibrio latis]|uniref:L-serine ammonia-lyase n=1 Tax=Parasalinivibrio latis TaxID=2952610 RepID=UPI0030E020BE